MNEQQPIRILIADDHSFFRKGLFQIIESRPGFKVVADAADGKTALELTYLHQPDLLILDIGMPEITGIEVTNLLRYQKIFIPILALSMHMEDEVLNSMIRAGAQGYLSKNIEADDLFEAIHQLVILKQNYIPSNASNAVRKILNQQGNAAQNFDYEFYFSPKELKIIQLICKEYNSKEIGAAVFLSPRTVEEYRERIMQKMNVRTVAGLVAFAVNHKLHETPIVE